MSIFDTIRAVTEDSYVISDASLEIDVLEAIAEEEEAVELARLEAQTKTELLALDELGYALEGLSDQYDVIASTLENGGMSAEVASARFDAIDAITHNVGTPAQMGVAMVGVESFDDAGSRELNTVAACEGIGDAFAKVWKAIKDFIAKIVKSIKTFFIKHFSLFARNVKRAEKLVSKAKNVKGEPEQKTVKLGTSACRYLSIGSKTQHYSKLVYFCNDMKSEAADVNVLVKLFSDDTIQMLGSIEKSFGKIVDTVSSSNTYDFTDVSSEGAELGKVITKTVKTIKDKVGKVKYPVADVDVYSPLSSVGTPEYLGGMIVICPDRYEEEYKKISDEKNGNMFTDISKVLKAGVVTIHNRTWVNSFKEDSMVALDKDDVVVVAESLAKGSKDMLDAKLDTTVYDKIEDVIAKTGDKLVQQSAKLAPNLLSKIAINGVISSLRKKLTDINDIGPRRLQHYSRVVDAGIIWCSKSISNIKEPKKEDKK